MTGGGAPARSEPPGRLAALDVWRGLIVVLMAVDHTAAFVGIKSMPEGLRMFGSRLRPTFESVGTWFTRFVTHYCAPGFVFLAGTSIVLFALARSAGGRSQGWISGHLILRGALLVALEYTVVNWGWGGMMPSPLFQVIGAIGVCLICGAGLRFVSSGACVIAGLLLLLGHPLLSDPELVPWAADVPAVWRRLLLVPEPMARPLPTIYPVVPWLAVFLLGIGFGRALGHDRARAMRWSGVAGMASLVAWFLIRWTDGFAAWLGPATDGWVVSLGTLTPYRPGEGWMDFMMMSKYPPAADFVLWSLGGGLLFLRFAHGRRLDGKAWAPLRQIGRVPLFFYLLHLYVYRWLAEAWLRDGEHDGGLGVVWGLWGVGLLVLWPASVVFGKLKRRYPGFPLDLF
ncbi:MAG: heparan-alpha-glucosaminide N-acetyltransferase domain-containing protein [Planctomycetota bacterium]